MRCRRSRSAPLLGCTSAGAARGKRGYTRVAVATAGAAAAAPLEECARGSTGVATAVRSSRLLQLALCSARRRWARICFCCSVRCSPPSPLLHFWRPLLPSQPYVAPASASSPDARPTLPGQAAATLGAALAHVESLVPPSSLEQRFAIASQLFATAVEARCSCSWHSCSVDD